MVDYFWYPEHTFLYFSDGLHPKLLFLVKDEMTSPFDSILSHCKVFYHPISILSL